MSIHISMTPGNIAALFAAMLVLASIPSMSVFAVLARSAAFGFRHGVLTACGIVLGDTVLMLIAVLGMSFIAESFGQLFLFIKYIGSAYLIWIGIQLWRSPAPQSRTDAAETNTSAFSSITTGLILTLGDQKAILFYMAFLPAFVDLTAVTNSDLLIIIAVTIIAVGGAKCVYAYLADRVILLIKPSASRAINRIAATILIATGLFIAIFS